jgi:hypothetical protein
MQRPWSPARVQGHAVLHDFCMCIPYGGITAVAGVAMLVLGAQQLGMQLAAAGAAVVAASVLSLRTWKAGGSSTPFTLASTGGRRQLQSLAAAPAASLQADLALHPRCSRWNTAGSDH